MKKALKKMKKMKMKKNEKENFRQICLNFLPLILSVAPNMLHFVRTFSITRA